MCNCIKEVPKKVEALLQQKENDKNSGITVQNVEWKDMPFFLSGPQRLKQELTYELVTKKKKGGVWTRKRTTAMFGIYCQFCGEKLIKDE